MDHAGLKTLIAATPELAALAAADPPDDAAIAAALNDPARIGVVSVASQDVKRELILAGKWPGIVIAARAGVPAAVNIVEALATFDTFDMTKDRYVQAITAGLTALTQTDPALIGAEDKSAVLALGVGPVALAVEKGFGIVTPSDVAAARGA